MEDPRLDEKVTDKVVVITGASSGLGAATARRLAGAGAKVVLGARRRERLEALVEEIEGAGGEALAVATDVTDREQVKRLADEAVGAFGRIDVWLNNAGIMPLAPLEDLKVDEWDRMIDVNLRGVLHGIAAALPVMKEQRSGHILNVSSVYGHKLGPAATVYCATKFAVRALSEGLRQATKPYGLRTTVLSPGAVATELLDHTSDEKLQSATRDFVDRIALPADSFARMVEFAIGQPAEVDVNEILFRPTAQAL